MANEEHKAIVRRYYDEIWNKGDVAVIDELMAPEYQNIDPATPNGGIVHGREGMRQLVEGYRATFPDIHFAISDQFAEGDIVVSRWVASGTMRGPLNGFPATGRNGAVTGITLSRFAGDLIIEDRVNWDTLGLLAQCGLLPQPESVAA
jgi:steroid delta-isomerase-like uncharacterized protein